jgi:hypothetical protein
VTAIISSQTGSGPRRQCNGTCHKARRPKCTCICVGRYHGIGTVRTITEAEAVVRGLPLEEVQRREREFFARPDAIERLTDAFRRALQRGHQRTLDSGPPLPWEAR